MPLRKPFLVVCILCSHTLLLLRGEAVENPLTLARALALTLEKSPVLSSYSWDIRAAEARIIQAKLSPNPEISLESEDITGSGRFKADRARETKPGRTCETGKRHGGGAQAGRRCVGAIG